MVHRPTGHIVGPVVPITEKDWPFDVPEPSVGLFRYMDWWKFEDLVANRRLYFRRSDRLDDDMEGRFSEGNKTFQTQLWSRFQEAHSLRPDLAMESRINESMRYRVFINCWNARDGEDARMWNTYTKSSDSVVIRSTCGLVDSSIAVGAYQPARVRYVSASEPRPEFHSLAPFYFKGVDYYEFESEVRFLLVDSSGTIYIDRKEDFSRTLSAEPERMITTVITHPRATKRFRCEVAGFCRKHLPNASVRRSTLPKNI